VAQAQLPGGNATVFKINERFFSQRAFLGVNFNQRAGLSCCANRRLKSCLRRLIPFTF
jgi:hypothetical protein